MLRKFFQVLYRSDIQKTGASQKIPASRRRPHVAGIFAHRKRKFLNIRSPGWRCLKTKVCRIRVDGRKLRFSNTMTSCLRSRLATIRRRYIWTQIFFKYGGKSLRFENTRLHMDGQILLENATCGSRHVCEDGALYDLIQALIKTNNVILHLVDL